MSWPSEFAAPAALVAGVDALPPPITSWLFSCHPAQCCGWLGCAMLPGRRAVGESGGSRARLPEGPLHQAALWEAPYLTGFTSRLPVQASVMPGIPAPCN